MSSWVAAASEGEWESFLTSQPWSPFLQSWTMGEVYRAIGEVPVRLEARDQGTIVGICQAIVVPARRGRHLAVMYGPVLSLAISDQRSAINALMEMLKVVAREHRCSFIRLSPFWPCRSRSTGLACGETSQVSGVSEGFRPSPSHLLAEHVWLLDLRGRPEEEIFANMRATTRNLVRRAEREGVRVEPSTRPLEDFPTFWRLHEETRRRHGFTPYSEAFMRTQLELFSDRGQALLYLAHYSGEVIAASIHMVYGGETSYHHGASTSRFAKVPASYLLQWTAICEAVRRGDRIYNFWGIAPVHITGNSKLEILNSKHPFAGVTTFKTGFGGQLLELVHCMDLPLSRRYLLTFGIEVVRKVRRGF